MAKEIAFENGSISNSEWLMTLTLIIILIIIADNKSLQQELTSPLTIMQLDKIVKIEKKIMSRHLINFSK